MVRIDEIMCRITAISFFFLSIVFKTEKLEMKVPDIAVNKKDPPAKK